MKLHHTYPLIEVLNALTAASESPYAVAERLKAEGRHT